MPRFKIYEMVPVYVSYCKIVEADTREDALRMAQEGWSDIEEDETGPVIGDDVIESVPVKYEAEPAPPQEATEPSQEEQARELYEKYGDERLRSCM